MSSKSLKNCSSFAMQNVKWLFKTLKATKKGLLTICLKWFNDNDDGSEVNKSSKCSRRKRFMFWMTKKKQINFQTIIVLPRSTLLKNILILFDPIYKNNRLPLPLTSTPKTRDTVLMLKSYRSYRSYRNYKI